MSVRTTDKPLGGNAYGSIGHLPGSRRGPADRGVNEGMLRICTERARDRFDEIIVTEKLDGSNVAVANIDGTIVPLVRAGYRAETSRFEQHQLFAQWVYANQERFLDALPEGYRISGEWLAQAHGTRYDLPHEPFVVFDVFGPTNARLCYKQQLVIACRGAFVRARLIHYGGPVSIAAVLEQLEPSGHGAIDPVEGAVWRVERHGEVDFLAKYVRPEKVDGGYFHEDPRQLVWNWRPDWEQR